MSRGVLMGVQTSPCTPTHDTPAPFWRVRVWQGYGLTQGLGIVISV